VDLSVLQPGLDSRDSIRVYFWVSDWGADQDNSNMSISDGIISKDADLGPPPTPGPVVQASPIPPIVEEEVEEEEGEEEEEELPEIKTIVTDTNIIITYRNATWKEIEEMKEIEGVYEEGVDYNQIYDGHGTGLVPPTEEKWEQMAQEMKVVVDIEVPGKLKTRGATSVDHTTSDYFPPIGDQQQEGSCVAWGVGYYMKTFQEASEHDWDLSGTTWDNATDSIDSNKDKIMSPEFLYHLINFGLDIGASYTDAYKLIERVGICSWENMPYYDYDHTTWPSEDAWREAPYYRTSPDWPGAWYYNLQASGGMDALKEWIEADNLAVISINANEYYDTDEDDLWTVDNIAWTSTNHANTIVGYDDNFGPYTEESVERSGAFKVANSWNLGPWYETDYDGDGCYWISYECMKQVVQRAYFDYDRIGYEPELLSVFKLTHSNREELDINVGIGSTGSPIDEKLFFDNCGRPFEYGKYGNPAFPDNPMPSNAMALDITEFLPDIYGKNFFLEVYDHDLTNPDVDGTIDNFTLEHYDDYSSGMWRTKGYVKSTDPIVDTIDEGTVYAELTLPVYVRNLDTGKCFDTIQAAIDDSTTLDGHYLEVSTGTFSEKVTVSKRLNIEGGYTSLNGGNGCKTTIDGGGGSDGDVVYITASGVVLKNFTIQNSGDGTVSRGATDAGIDLNGASGVAIRNVSLDSNYYGMYLTSSTDNLISNSTIESSSNQDIQMSSSSLTSLNTTLDDSLLNLNSGSTFYMKWFLHVLVNDSAGDPMSGIQVKVQDNGNGPWQDTFTTDATGAVRFIEVTEFEETDSGGRVYHTPHTIDVDPSGLLPDGFVDDPRDVFMDSDGEAGFENMPEFHLLVMPFLGSLIAIVVIVRRVRKKRD
jgi:parallel beta-helix repeat protein